jgi:hypothetical protein
MIESVGVRTLLVDPLRPGAQSHDVRPRQTDELGGVVLVLDVIRVGVGVVALHNGQDPAPVLVRSGDLGRNLLSRSGAELAPLALPDAEGRGPPVKVGRRALVLGDDVHVAGPRPRRLQPLQEPPDGHYLVHFHALKVPGDRHRQFAGRGVLPDGNSWPTDVARGNVSLEGMRRTADDG